MAMNLVQTAAGGAYLKMRQSSAVGSLVMALDWTVARGATNTVVVGICQQTHGSSKLLSPFRWYQMPRLRLLCPLV